MTRTCCPAPVWRPAMALAGRCGLAGLVAAKLTLQAPGGVNAAVKVPALVAAMVAGADSIDDLDLLRHGGMGRLFTGIRAPSTLGTFLRTFTFGHVRQLDAVAAGFLINLTGQAPVLRDAGVVTFLDVDDTVEATHGYTKQGAGYGYSGVKGLNGPIATVSTPRSAPLIAATRLGKGVRELGPRRGPADRRRAGHHLAVRRDRAGDSARRQRLLQPRRGRRAPPRRGERLDHRPDNPAVLRAISAIEESAWTPGPVPERDLGRRRAAAGLRRAGRRDPEHPRSPHAAAVSTSTGG